MGLYMYHIPYDAVVTCMCDVVHAQRTYLQNVAKIARYIQQQNREIYEPRGIIIGDPMDRGLRCVSSMCVCVRECVCVRACVRVRVWYVQCICACALMSMYKYMY